MDITTIPGHEVLTEEHQRLAKEIVKAHRAHDGMIPMDIERFWEEDEIARRNPFGKDIPQMPFGGILNGECVYDELSIPVDMWRYGRDVQWRLEINKQYNDLSEKIVGRRLLNETPPPENPKPSFPGTKGLNDIFEAKNVWHDESWWLTQSANTPSELDALLDRVEARLKNLREFILPENWDDVKDELLAQGIKPRMYRAQRGPITFATSIYGVENLIFLLMDNPDLAIRYRDAIFNSMLGIITILNEEASYTDETAPRGFTFLDDNCYLMTPDMYELFGYPILKAVFDKCSPAPGDHRGQHSDSPMSHLLPILGRFNLKYANFGPTVMVDEIRRHMPNAIIHGQLAPFTYSRNEEERMVLELFRDYELSKEKRGLLFTTAGSINNGSRLTGMRLLMATIQKYGRY